MTRSAFRCAMLAWTLAACASSAKRPSPPPLEVFGEAFKADARQATLPAWLLYGMNRRVYIDVTFHDRFPKQTAYRYTFEEELTARDAIADLWTEMRKKQSVSDRYLDEISKVYLAGFMKEYVWHCVPHPVWQSPAELRSAEFSAWLSEKLPQHEVETWVKAMPSPAGTRVIVGLRAHPPIACADAFPHTSGGPSSAQ